MKTHKPMTFKRDSGFIWSMMGSAIGFANILSFSSQCYKNGGGAFLIPFVIAILILGLPMLFLEGTIGHRMNLPIVPAFGQFAGKVGKSFGWLSVIAVATIGTFYMVLTGYSLAYAYLSGVSAIPADTALFFKESFLHDSGNLATSGSFSWPIFLCAALVAGFSWFVLIRNIRSGLEKLCSLFLPLLCAIILLFAVIVCFLPGSMMGFYHYLVPDFAKLKEISLWRDVFGHVFFSFSLGLGIVTGYARHTKETLSIPRAMAFVALGDLIISVVAGFAIFGCIGYLCHVTGAPFSSIVSSDSTFEMGFVIFPRILQVMGPWLSPIVGVTFFSCVFIAGITGVFSIMESVLGNIEVEFSKSRKWAATLTHVLLLLGAIPMCFGNGQHIIGALAPLVLGNNMLLGGLAEILVFLYLAKAVREDVIWHGHRAGRMAYMALRYAAPAILGIILVVSLQAEFSASWGLSETVRWSWFGIALLLSAGLAQRRTKQLVSSVT